MEIKIQSIHFDATEKLEAFIEKKVAKLEKSFEDIQKVEVQLKVVKPATAQNKEASLEVFVPGTTLFVEVKTDSRQVGLCTYAGRQYNVIGSDKRHCVINSSVSGSICKLVELNLCLRTEVQEKSYLQRYKGGYRTDPGKSLQKKRN